MCTLDLRTCSRVRGNGRAFQAALVSLLVLVVASVPAHAQPTVWVVPSLVRVVPDAAAGTATQIDLYAARGETESFQIIVRAPSGGLTGVNVTAPNLGGPTCTLYREQYIYLATGSADWATNRNKPLGPGWYPDGLIPFVNPATGQDLTGATLDAVPFSLAAGHNQPIWVDVYVPRTQAPGLYSGAFTVTSGQGSASVKLNLHVWAFTLPLKPALHSCFLYWNVRAQLQPDQELLRHRLMPINTALANERTLIDTLGLNSTNLGFWSGVDGTGGTMPPAPTLAQLQQAVATHQPDLYLYNYTADEISGLTSVYPGVQAWARNLHAVGVDQMITMPPDPLLYDDGSGTGRSAVDVWSVLPKQYDAAGGNIATVLQKGDKVWSYNTLQQDDYSPKWLLDYAPINFRIQPGFISESLGLTGLLYWRLDDWSSDPWNNALAFPGYPGEGMLVYPGDQVGLPGTVIGSMRLKYLRDGVDDYDYIELLKQAGYGDWALSLARTIGPDWSNWTRDPNALEAVRLQLGNMLDSLSPNQHRVDVSVAANPSTVAAGSPTQLTATATDSLGYAMAKWSWSDGGAGGKFSSTTAQNPIYTVPAALAGRPTITLTVTATSAGTPVATGSGSVTLTVPTTPHTLAVTATANPNPVGSSQQTNLTAVAVDSYGVPVASWSWSDGNSGGKFSPSAKVQNPTYTAPSNKTGGDKQVTLTVTATSSGPSPISARGTTTLVVNTFPHVVTVTGYLWPTTVASAGTTQCSATFRDSCNHDAGSWLWTDSGAGGIFLDPPTTRQPRYRAPVNATKQNLTVTLTVTAICNGPVPASGSASFPLTVKPQ